MTINDYKNFSLDGGMEGTLHHGVKTVWIATNILWRMELTI